MADRVMSLPSRIGVVALVSAVVIGALSIEMARRSSARPAGQAEPLVVYCAAGLKGPVEAILADYRDRYGVETSVQYGGSGSLLSTIMINPAADLFIPADDSYSTIARSRGLTAESIPLATMRPVIAVKSGNPLGIGSLGDLVGDGVRVALANPDQAAIGAVTRQALEEAGLWSSLSVSAIVFKPTVNDVAQDVALGMADAAIVWDATAAMFDGVEGVEDARLSALVREVQAAVVSTSSRPTEALRLARFLGARETGRPAWTGHGFGEVEADAWAESPELVLFAGSMFNSAIESAVRDFEVREGVRVVRKYNGCGVLVAEMKTGVTPDAYFACDVAFMDEVGDRFRPPHTLSRNPIVIAVRKGNPEGVRSLADLSRPGLKVGLGNPERSALGRLTMSLLEAEGVREGIERSGNWVVDSPQSDLLVMQLAAGDLDAVLCYVSNATPQGALVETIAIDSPLAVAEQPYAVSVVSDHGRTMGRLLDRIRAAEPRFLELGFEWVGESAEGP